MRIITFKLIFISIYYLCFHPLNAQTIPVYPNMEISDIFITIEADSLDLILATGNEESDHEYPATFIFHNSFAHDTVANVGFRLRGNTSRYSQKKSFKVSFNTFQPGLKFYGYEKLNLNGEHNDPSIIRSKLSWDLFKTLGVPSSNASYVRLYINKSYYGLYINVEHIDENFVYKKYGNSDGNLYKCLWPADLTYRSDNPDDYKFQDGDRRTYDLKTNRQTDDYADIAKFIDILNHTSQQQFVAVLDSYFNIDQYLKILAVDAVTGSWDNYWFLKNNFYMYHNSATDKFEFIPYDYDNTFGIWWDGILSGIDWGTRDIYHWGHPNEPRPLATRILENPDLRNRFSYYLNFLLEKEFNPQIINAKIDSIHLMISEAAINDEYRTLDYGYTIDDFNNSYDNALGGHVIYGLKPYISARYISALEQNFLVNIAPFIATVNHYPSAVQITDSIHIVAIVRDDHSLDLVKLFYMEEGLWSSADMLLTESTSGVINEFTYSVTLPPVQSDNHINFYISAIDDSGEVATLPIDAPGNYFSVRIGYEIPKLYINEFLASNDNLFADNFGEYDDWIEIYNGESKDINLQGYYLSDNFDNPDKWAFPDTMIRAGAFLVLWADEDQEQGSLHTNFKINKAGEQLGIFNSVSTNFAPVDTFSFKIQTINISYGRFPDGTEAWQTFDPPTPGSANQTVNDVADHSGYLPSMFRLEQNYPNPFNPATMIEFNIPHISHVILSVYDISGRLVNVVINKELSAGSHQVYWEARSNASGVYLYYIIAGSYSAVKKMILLR